MLRERGALEKFGHYDLFDIKVATPALNNVEVTQGPSICRT